MASFPFDRTRRSPDFRSIAIAVSFLLVVSGASLRAQDYYEARLRAGESNLSAGNAPEAAVDLRIAAFGLLRQPALLCEALAHLALAEQAAGRKAASDEALTRYSDVARRFPECRDARLEGRQRAEFESLVRQRHPSPAAERMAAAAPTARPAPPVVRPTAAPTSAPPVPTSIPVAAAPPPTPVPTAARVASAPPPTAVPTAVRVAAAPPPPTPTAKPVTPPTAPGSAAGIAVTEDLDRQPQLKTTTRPVYPAGALADRVGGVVLLRVLVSEKGEPQRVEVSRGVRADLDEAAVAAVRQWTFEPGRKGNAATAAWMMLAVPFDAKR